MFWKRKNPVEICADVLYRALKDAVKQGGRIRVDEPISAAAAIVGEAAIGKAGDFDPRRHDYPPGARVFSTKINQLICADECLQEAPADSILGDLRDRLRACGFSPSDFPRLDEVFKHFGDDVGTRLRAATAVLARGLCETRDSHGQDVGGGENEELSEPVEAGRGRPLSSRPPGLSSNAPSSAAARGPAS